MPDEVVANVNAFYDRGDRQHSTEHRTTKNIDPEENDGSANGIYVCYEYKAPWQDDQNPTLLVRVGERVRYTDGHLYNDDSDYRRMDVSLKLGPEGVRPEDIFVSTFKYDLNKYGRDTPVEERFANASRTLEVARDIYEGKPVDLNRIHIEYMKQYEPETYERYFAGHPALEAD